MYAQGDCQDDSKKAAVSLVALRFGKTLFTALLVAQEDFVAA
jgi:hypothetical protein